jgi:broad specificity phosphatase PhoE
VLTSPYRRAADTARTAVESAGLALDVWPDERLRERDLGAFDGLTASGIRELHEVEAERRARTGKLYYRPPGGESWCDVALRVRSLLLTWREQHAGQRVAVVSHQAVIMCARFVLEELSEDELLSADRGDPLANCSLTTYTADPEGRLRLRTYNDTAAVDASEEAPVTEEPDADEPDAAEPDVAEADTERRARS